MRVRDWQDLLDDVTKADVDPDRWRAVAGTRARGLGEDMYLAHPEAGLYHLKTYAKNPFELRGVGARLARHLDDEIGPYLPQETGGRFAVQRPPANASAAERAARRLAETVRAHADAPTTPADLFDDAMAAIESPAFGPLDYEGPSGRPAALEGIAAEFPDAEDLLDAELDDLIEGDGVGRGFN